MASFSCWVTSTSTDSISFRAQFTGGDSSYANYRYVGLTINGTEYFRSTNKGGANSYFSFTVSGLTAGTTYIWEATLYYIVGQSPPPYYSTGYGDEGTATTDKAAPTKYGSLTVDSVTDRSITVSYEWIENASSVQIRWRASTESSWSYTTLSYSPVTFSELDSNTTYYFNYRGVASDGSTYGPWMPYNVSATTLEGGFQVYIGTGTYWQRYIAYIGTGSGWVKYNPKIGGGSVWLPQ